MKNRLAFVFVLVLLMLCLANCSRAGSIWARRNKNMRGLYTDDVARQIGDTLTIKISEVSTVDNKAKRNLSKTTARSNTFNGQLGIVSTPSGAGKPSANYLPRIPAFNMTAESSNTLDGKADYKDEREFTDLITVVVVDIMPNRNLVVMGTRSREIAGDTQLIEVSGIVRPSDIAYDNTIKSERVGNFSLIVRHTGIGADFNKPGWLGRIFDILWPF